MLYGREETSKALLTMGGGEGHRTGKGGSRTRFWKTTRAAVAGRPVHGHPRRHSVCVLHLSPQRGRGLGEAELLLRIRVLTSGIVARSWFQALVSG